MSHLQIQKSNNKLWRSEPLIKRRFLFCLFFLTLTCVGLGFALVAAIREWRGEQRIVESSTHCDFGTVHVNQMLECELDIVNPSKEVLEITDVNHTCGCIESELGTSTIPAHGSTTLKMVIKAGRKPGRSVMRTVVSAQTKGTRKEYRYFFLISALPKRVIQIADKGYKAIMLGHFQLQNLPVRKVLSITRGDYPMEWDELQCRSSNDNIDTKLERVGLESWNLKLELRNTGAIGDVRSHLIFSFLNKGKLQPYHLVRPVQAYIVGPIFTSPKSLLLGTIRPGEKVKGRVSLHAREHADHQIEILSVDTAYPNRLQPNVSTEKSGEEVSLVFSAPYKKGIYEGRVIITAKLDEVYQVYVSYLGYILE